MGKVSREYRAPEPVRKRRLPRGLKILQGGSGDGCLSSKVVWISLFLCVQASQDTMRDFWAGCPQEEGLPGQGRQGRDVCDAQGQP